MYSVKERAKKEWKKFYIMKKIKKIFDEELSFFDRVNFLLFGKF